MRKGKVRRSGSTVRTLIVVLAVPSALGIIFAVAAQALALH